MKRCLVLLSLLAAAQPVVSFNRPSAQVAALQEDVGKLTRLASEVNQVPGKTTKTTHKSWFSRMGDAFKDFIFGLVLITFSIPVLWVNEGRAARMEGLIAQADETCRSVKGGVALEENYHALVHLEGEPMVSSAEVSDPTFDICFSSDCVRLRATVEVYQVIEEKSEEERETFGGGKETVTTYNYKQEWSAIWNDSSSYEEAGQRINKKPEGVNPGMAVQDCNEVQYGQDFVLPESFVQQCTDFQCAHGRLEDVVSVKASGVKFTKKGDWYFTADSAQPAVGDARVNFDYIPDGPASVMALQVEGSKADAEKGTKAKSTFLPFRIISRGCLCCAISEEEEKRRLREEADKSCSQLAEEASCGGPFSCLCCACNLVSMFFASVLTEEIYHLFQGSKDKGECIDIIQARTNTAKWVIRICSWLCLLFGTFMLFSPLLTFIKVVPFLGPLVAKLGGALIFFLCFFATLLIASLVSGLAYLVYRPVLGITCLVLTAMCVAIPFVLMKG